MWNKASRSTVASDTVQEVNKRNLIVPNVTRWNSYYDAVLSVGLNELCTKLQDLHRFNEREFKPTLEAIVQKVVASS